MLIDALPGRGDPGETVVLEVDRGPDLDRPGRQLRPARDEPGRGAGRAAGAGWRLPPTYVVGCRTRPTLDDGIGLSATMTAAVPGGAAVRELLRARPWTQPVLIVRAARPRGAEPMCLGIPGQVVEMVDGYGGQLALVDVQGARRKINSACLSDPSRTSTAGDWVLIHMGFAVERVDAAGAEQALQGLELMGRGRDVDD